MLTSTVTTFETTGNGSNTSFTFNYPIHKSTDLLVYAEGALKSVGDSTYAHTVTVATNKQSATVVFTTAPGNLKPLKFEREVEYKQETDLSNNSLFDAESLETSLDNIVMQLQQVGAVVTSSADSRTLSFDGGIASSDYNTDASTASTLNSNKAARSNKALMFDANGDITVSGDNLDTTIDYQLEAKDWASKASGNVNTYTGGVENADGTATSAKAQATAAAADAASVATIYDNFDDRYLGAHTTAQREVGVENIGLDHDGIALVDGAMYFDTTLNAMKVWDLSGTAWVQIAPGTTSQTNIDILTTKYDGSTSASSGTNLNIAQVDTAADNIADISKVADIDANVSLVADIDGYVTTVAANNSNITDVAGVDSEITLLGTSAMATASSGHLALLGTSAMAHAATGHIKKVADISTHVSNVSGISAAVSGVNTISADVTAVNADAVDIGKVAAVDTEVGLLGALDTEIGLLGTSAYAHASTGFIKLVAEDATDIGTVAGKADEIGLLGTTAMAHASTGNLTLLGTSAMAHATTGYLKLVGDIDGDVTAVAGKATEIGRLGTVDAVADMAILGSTTVTDDMAILGSTTVTDDMALLAVPAVITDMDLLGASGVIANIATVSSSIADVNRYANEYTISGSEPGSPSEGDIWMDTTSHTFKVHNGTSFTTVTEGQSAAEVTAEATAQAISMSIALG